MKNFIKKLLDRFGLVLQKKQPWMNNYGWLSDFDIKTVIDVGANRGQYVEFIRSLLPHAKILSFEPIKEVYSLLQKATRSDVLVETFNIGLGDVNATSEINVNNFSPSSSMLELEKVHIDNISHTDISKINSKESIEIRRLDDVVDIPQLEGNFLIKLDVQGFEDKVILGGKNVIQSCSVAIIETSFVPLYKGEKTFGQIYKLMNKLGFEYYGSLNQFKSNADGRPIYCDALFINNKFK